MMTTVIDDVPKTTQAAPTEPPVFSPTFDKARKSYGIATALLLAWALTVLAEQRRALATKVLLAVQAADSDNLDAMIDHVGQQVEAFQKRLQVMLADPTNSAE